MHSPVNEETVIPDSGPGEVVEDAPVTDEVAEVEAVEADAKPEEIEATEDGEVKAESEEADEPEESSPSKPDGAQKRIDELTKIRREAERERDYYKNLVQNQQPEPEHVEPGKTLADFEYDEGKYAEYLTAQAKAEAKVETDRTVQQERFANLQADYSGREADFSKDIDDYHTAISNPALVFSNDMVNATLTAEKGPELRYYLAKNPEVSAKLAKMQPFDMAIELGRIEATKLGKNKPPSVTTAPKPVPKIAGTDSKSSIRIDDPKISDAQFRRLREKQIANR